MTFTEIINEQIKSLERKRAVLVNKEQSLNCEDNIALSNLNGKIFGLKSALITFEQISNKSEVKKCQNKDIK